MPTKTYNGSLVVDVNNNPTVTTIGTNNLGNISWSRLHAGGYRGVLAGAFIQGKTIVHPLPQMYKATEFGMKPITAIFNRESADSVLIQLLLEEDSSGIDLNDSVQPFIQGVPLQFKIEVIT